jgi:alpha-beta hydrolase superfamily lysophospholipase
VLTYDRTIDVTGFPGGEQLAGRVLTQVSVHLPDRVEGPVTVFFGFPGGGYGRGYYDIRVKPGYSQAEYHTGRGHVFVACDHLGVGDSSQPDPFLLSFEVLAAANAATAGAVLDGLTSGTLIAAEPLVVERTVAMGQSMGGCLLTVQQGAHATFDAVALLGWSGLETNFPAPDGTRLTYPMPPRGTDLRPLAEHLAAAAPGADHFRFCFHWPTADAALVNADMASHDQRSGVVRGDATAPWGSATTPICAITMMTPGSVAAEAAAIAVPVLVGCGVIDVVPDPWSEPSAYRASRDVSVVVVDEMAHMHNFAGTRTQLWDRIETFAAGVPVAKKSSSR